ncbi:hypothetical protein [Nonomuraea typhae]|uniref:hypothetical protein n=1 Tax=Nonomuraea typhae TaxID=2603600 RepID=UPI0012FA3802|nr:hypothetical protein [Nonomuraea typhae]
MSDDENKDSDNIDRFPDHEDMPEEIAAIGIPEGDKGELHIIINKKEGHRRSAYRFLRPGVLIPAILSAAVEPIVRRIREHQMAAAVAGTAVASTAAVIGIGAVLERHGEPLALPTPPALAITMPPQTVTATISTPTRTRITTRPARTRPLALVPVQSSQPPAQESSAPATSRTLAPTRSNLPPTRDSSPTEPRVESDGRPNPPPSPPPSASALSPAPDPTRPSASSPAAAVDAPDCAIQVDLNPLLEVCLLS